MASELMGRPLKVYLVSMCVSMFLVVGALVAADALGFFGGWPSVPRFLLGFALGWQCQRFSQWMERRAERRELAT